MATGAALIVLSIVILVSSPPDEAEAVAPTTTVAPITTTTSQPTPPTTNSTVVTTTTTLPTTTTTVDGRAVVGGFVTQFGNAIANGDTEFVQSRLHPSIVEGFGADVCEAWVISQIMALENYTATGVPQGPTNGTLSTPAGTVDFENRYSVEVTFTFAGQEFESTADFILEDSTVYFTGTCQS